MCHVTKDTSHARESNVGTSVALPPSATQSRRDEPQPCTSTADLFNAASTSPAESVSSDQDNPSTSGKGLVY